MNEQADALFEESGDRLAPTELAAGPWDPANCHGGPPSALLARAVEQHNHDEGVEWQVARLTIELLRPIRVRQPLRVVSTTERAGRRISVVTASLIDGENEVAGVRALRIRRREDELPSGVVPASTMPAPVEESRPDVADFTDDRPSYVGHACEFRFASGGWNQLGECAVWIRLLQPVIAGESPSGLQRVAAAADFGNGVSADVDFTSWLYINPDLTIHLARPADGEWIGLRASSHLGGTGTGLAHSVLHDENGPLGLSLQSLLVEPR